MLTLMLTIHDNFDKAQSAEIFTFYYTQLGKVKLQMARSADKCFNV